ncbi:b(0,+)-type amino acid transporter 1-like [Gigantopelta aegis]|uniref:b(0,+)-type amino acid transporter 1-like n=1 Tax=Gigantopelta aegis TaxID=1735272 RepID=UPI001B88C3DC|nr:b(0,+)-type amino acid transporter 1-like [Gigantopelta aegis]
MDKQEYEGFKLTVSDTKRVILSQQGISDVHKRSKGSNTVDNDAKHEKNGNVVVEQITMGKHVGLPSGISLIVGTIIGSGIFISPKSVLKDTGSIGLCLIVWAASGIIALFGGLVYAELGLVVKKSGGEYAYIREAFGNVPAFLFAWTSVVVIRTSSLSIICLTFAEYVDTFFEMCGQPEIPKKLVAALAIVTVALVNGYSTNLAARVQVVFTVAKLLALVVIIIGGIVKLAQGSRKELDTGFLDTNESPSTIALAFYGALWAYDGWNNLNYVTEELQNPKRNLPIANITGVVLVTAVYIMTNISYFAVMTRQELLDAPAVAVLWGDRVIGAAAVLIPVAVMISTFGAANGTAFTANRVTYVAARDNNLPAILSYIHYKNRTPLPSMIFTCTLSLMMIIPGNIGSLIDFFSFTAWMFYGMAFTALIVLRFTKKDAERPYKVPIPIPILMVLVALYLVIAPIVEEPRIEFLYALLFVLGGLIFYVPFVHFNIKLKVVEYITIYLQLFLEVVPSPYVHEESELN